MKTATSYFFSLRNKLAQIYVCIIVLCLTVPLTLNSQVTAGDCGIPVDLFWDFEDILSCPDMECNGNGDFPELFPKCLCGPSPGQTCNYRASHGTPHLHLIQENHFGAMISRTNADPLAGEGIFFCIPTAKTDICYNLNFDLLVNRRYHYETAQLKVELVNPEEMEIQLGWAGECTTVTPAIETGYSQTVEVIDVSEFSEYNMSNTFYTHNIDFYYTINDDIISDVDGTYYLWFYFENSDTFDEIVGIDNIQLTEQGLVCNDLLVMFEPYYPVQGGNYALWDIILSTINGGELPLDNTATFTAGRRIFINPHRVYSDLTLGENEYLLFEIDKGIQCQECGHNAPLPFASSQNDFINFGDNALKSEYNNEGESKNSESYLTSLDSEYTFSMYNLLGQLVSEQTSTPRDYQYPAENNLLLTGVYVLVTKFNGEILKVEKIVVK